MSEEELKRLIEFTNKLSPGGKWYTVKIEGITLIDKSKNDVLLIALQNDFGVEHQTYNEKEIVE